MESAIDAPKRRAGPAVLVKARHDSQGSLPKTGSNAYLDDNATEL
jgi:hypothetical protein